MPGNKLLVSITLLLLWCTYRLQQRAASVCVAGCGGATRPVAGGSDWGCWDCAAASRTGCPNGLAVRDDRQSHTAEHKDSNTRTQTCNKGHEATHKDAKMWGRWTRQEDRKARQAKSKRGRETGEVTVKTREVQSQRRK